MTTTYLTIAVTTDDGKSTAELRGADQFSDYQRGVMAAELLKTLPKPMRELLATEKPILPEPRE